MRFFMPKRKLTPYNNNINNSKKAHKNDDDYHALTYSGLTGFFFDGLFNFLH